uniref:Latexin n=1 Tax=Latimeria chalumnae TaxID=7897 RepID=H3AWZ7_LATCH
ERSAMEVSPSHKSATRAVRAAEHWLTYNYGSPHKAFITEWVKKAAVEDIPGVGNKYHIQFSVKDAVTEQNAGSCSAEVLYQTGHRSAPDVKIEIQGTFGRHTQEEDEEFYLKMKNRQEPLVGQDIPDSFGNVSAEMKPIWTLAIVGSSYIMWQNSTENTLYNMAQVKSVKQVKRNDDDALEFEYTVLLHELISQEIIPWQMKVFWHPKEGIKVEEQVLPHKRHNSPPPTHTLCN